MPGPTIWNSALVQQMLERLRMGLPADLSCFYRGDIELKAADILYQLTQEETDEFHKCSSDIVYFVEKYCRFLTDIGRTVVHLRDYQKKILRALAKETIKNILGVDELVPVIRNLIMMQSRQSGKCLFNSDIILIYPNGEKYKVPIQLFYYMILSKKRKLSLIEKVKVKLLILYLKLDKKYTSK